MNHPVLNDALAVLRNKHSDTSNFRAALHRAGVVLATESLRILSSRSIDIETPLQKTQGAVLQQEKVLLVPILRAGLGFVDSFRLLLPGAIIGHLGMARDHESLEAKVYYENIPLLPEDIDIFVLDPMLATGNSSVAALKKLSERTCRSMTLVTLLAAPEGIQKVSENFPRVHIVTGAVDEKLNEKGYIVPGLGDAGDRYFGT